MGNREMARHGIQILLVVALVFGAASQTLACISMMQAGNHACCRMVSTKKTAQKMRAAPSSNQKPAQSPDCCGLNSSRPQQAPHKNSDLKRVEPTMFANRGGITIIPVRREANPLSRLLALPGDSPPLFILHHSLLI
jgi:hypothetical protein